MNTKEDNDVIDHIGIVYIKNNTKLSWPIGSGGNYDENQIGQWHDWSYR